jgi:hypothetical protein
MKLHFHNLTALGGHDRGYAFYVASANGSREKPPLGSSDIYQIKNSPAAVKKSRTECFMVVGPEGYIVDSELTLLAAIQAAESYAESRREHPDVHPAAFVRVRCENYSLAPRR